MPEFDSKTKTLAITNLGEGLHTDVNLFDIPSGGASLANNLVWVEGYLRARPGLAQIYSPNLFAGEEICHLALYTDFDANVTLMAVTRPTPTTLNIYKYTTSWLVVATALAGDADIPITSCNFKRFWWVTTGAGDMYRYDGTTLVAVKTLQATNRFKIFDSPRIVVAGDSRLFIAGCCTSNDGSNTEFVPYRVAWSDFLLGEVWGGGVGGGSSGYVDLAQDSAPVSGLYYSNSALLAFKPNSIYLGYAAGPPKTYDFRQFVSGVGCISHQSIKRFREGQIIWLGDDDVYLGGSSVTPTPLGARIRPRLRSVVNLPTLSRSLAVIDQQNYLYHLILPSGSSPFRTHRLFTVNLRNGSWWEGSLDVPGISIGGAVEFRLGPWRNRQLLGSSAGLLYDFDLGNTTDDGTSFACTWRSGMAAVRRLTNNQLEQANLLHIRIQAPYKATGQVALSALYGNGMDRMQIHSFGNQQVNGTADFMGSSQTPAGEHFQLQLDGNAATWPPIAELGVAFNTKGQTMRWA